MEDGNLQNGTAVDNCGTGNGCSGTDTEQVDTKSSAEHGSVPCDPTGKVPHKDGLLDSGDKSETIGSVPEDMPVTDDGTVNGLVSNGDLDPSGNVSGMTSSIPEGTTLEMSDKNIPESALEEAADLPKESDLVSQGSEDMFFDPSMDEPDTEQWHEASDNAQLDSIIQEGSLSDYTQPFVSPHSNLQSAVNTEDNSSFISPDSGAISAKQTGESCQADKTEVSHSNCSGQQEFISEENKTNILEPPCAENQDFVPESQNEEKEETITDLSENTPDLISTENEGGVAELQGEAVKGNVQDSTERSTDLGVSDQAFVENQDYVSESQGEANRGNILDSVENKINISGLPCVGNEDTLDSQGEEKQENTLDSAVNKQTGVTEPNSDVQAGLDDTLSNNSASIDLGKFGEISLSTQLSTQMSEGTGNLATSQEGDSDVLPVDDIHQKVCQFPDTEDHKETGVDLVDPLPAVSSDQPLEPLPMPIEGGNISETFTGKAVGSERISVERKPYELTPGHVEIDLSAQLENIFAGEDSSQLLKSENMEKSVNEVFPDSPKAKTFDSSLLAKKENADSGVDNDDEFESLDKEIVMLRERYRSTQDRIQKALHDDTDIGKRSKDTKEMSPETAYAKFRAQRLGSAPVSGEKYDYGIGSTLSAKARQEKDSGFRTVNYGARRIVKEQAELCSKLKDASQSFEELEEEIRSLKYDFWGISG